MLLTYLGGMSAWAFLDGLLATLGLLIGVLGGALGVYVAWRAYRRNEAKHKAEMAALETERRKMELEIERLRRSG